MRVFGTANCGTDARSRLPDARGIPSLVDQDQRELSIFGQYFVWAALAVFCGDRGAGI
jgi:hypothetical protein